MKTANFDYADAFREIDSSVITFTATLFIQQAPNLLKGIRTAWHYGDNEALFLNAYRMTTLLAKFDAETARRTACDIAVKAFSEDPGLNNAHLDKLQVELRQFLLVLRVRVKQLQCKVKSSIGCHSAHASYNT